MLRGESLTGNRPWPSRRTWSGVARYLSDPACPDASRGPGIVFEGPEGSTRGIDDPALDVDDSTSHNPQLRADWLSGSAEVVQHAAAAYAQSKRCPRRAVHRRWTSERYIGEPSILDASRRSGCRRRLGPAANWVNRVPLDLQARRVDALVPAEELDRRRAEPGQTVRENRKHLGRSCTTNWWVSSRRELASLAIRTSTAARACRAIRIEDCPPTNIAVGQGNYLINRTQSRSRSVAPKNFD